MKIYRYFKDNKGVTTYRAGIELGMAPHYIGSIVRIIEEKGYLRIARINGQRDFSQIMFLKKPELRPKTRDLSPYAKSNKTE